MIFRLSQVMELAVHRPPSEALPPNHKNNHTNRCYAHSQGHPSHHRWDETLRHSPVIKVEDHTELR